MSDSFVIDFAGLGRAATMFNTAVQAEGFGAIVSTISSGEVGDNGVAGALGDVLSCLRATRAALIHSAQELDRVATGIAEDVRDEDRLLSRAVAAN